MTTFEKPLIAALFLSWATNVLLIILVGKWKASHDGWKKLYFDCKAILDSVKR